MNDGKVDCLMNGRMSGGTDGDRAFEIQLNNLFESGSVNASFSRLSFLNLF